MKIALIAPTPIPARRANTIQVMKMAAALQSLGHEVRVGSPGEEARPPGWEELARQYGLQQPFPLTWIPSQPGLRSYDYGLRAVRWARKWDADLIYTRLPQAAALASQLGQAILLEMHDFPPGKAGPFLFRLFLKGSGARRVVAISRALAADLLAHFPLSPELPFLVIAPDGVDLVRYENLPSPAAARRELALPDRFTAGYTGHLYTGRGIDLLLTLAGRLPEVHFLLVGGEPADVARTASRVREHGLQNVTLTGFIPNAELPRYQAASDVLLMPYQLRVAASSGGNIARYLSPMKLFEYLACGRAILSSDLPVLREVLNEKVAVLLPPDDVNAWEAALRSLHHHPGQRAALAAHAQKLAANFTWESRARKILQGL